MAKRASIRGEQGGKGLDAVFTRSSAGAKDSKTAKQQDSKLSKPKTKATLYLGEDAVNALDDLRLALRREHGLSPSQASKSSVVEALLILQGADPAELAALLKRGE